MKLTRTLSLLVALLGTVVEGDHVRHENPRGHSEPKEQDAKRQLSGDCEVVCIDFSKTADNKTLSHGDYIRAEWYYTYGLTIEASTTVGGFTPNGKARIYDTTKQGQDPDLQSPNEKCGGSGKGAGGEPGEPGENCNPKGEGNVLIIQESDSENPNDNALGGTIKFSFGCLSPRLVSVGLIDIETTEQAFFNIYKEGGGAPATQMILGLGDNSIQTEEFQDAEDVNSFSIVASNSFGVRSICFCPPPCIKRPSVDPAPVFFPPMTSPVAIDEPSIAPTPFCFVNSYEDLLVALESATGPDSTEIVICPGTITFTTGINLNNQSVAFSCPSKDCVLDGELRSQLFTAYDDCHLKFTDIIFRNGLALGQAGAVAMSGREGGTATAIFRQCAFEGNSIASGFGVAGAVAQSRATTFFDQCTFSENQGRRGGAFHQYEGESTFLRCDFSDNFSVLSSPEGGGAVYHYGIGRTSASYTQCTFQRNEARIAGGGGGAAFHGNGTVSFADCNFTSNMANGFGSSGGAIRQVAGTTKIKNCAFCDNESPTGQDISADGTSTTIIGGITGC